MKKIAIVISGRGSNMSAIIRGQEWGYFRGAVVGVFSDNKNAPGLKVAEQMGIPAFSIDPSKCDSRDEFDAELADMIDQVGADIIVLAGFMRILGERFVNKYEGRIINIHPSLLPKYKGLNTHQRAIDAGDTIAGASIHYVTKGLDDGPVIEQIEVSILPDDTAETLQQRVLEQEHHLYLRVLRDLCREPLDK
jgi:phosphoribosylglycinamide formyltransferase 1